jgi:hypothetical protein
LTTALIGLGLNLWSSWQAIDNTETARREAKAQREKEVKFSLEKLKIAQNVQSRADQIHSVWRDHYLPCEIATVNEICSVPDAVANEAVVAQRAVAEVAKVFATKKRSAIYCLSPQHTGARAEVEFKISTEKADLAAGLVQQQVAAERARVTLLNNQNMQNRMNVINPGRGHAANVGDSLLKLSDIYSGLIRDSDEALANAARTQGRALASLVSTGEDLIKGGRKLLGEAEAPISYRRATRTQPSSVQVVIDNNKPATEEKTTPYNTEEEDYYVTSGGRYV